MPRKVNRTYAEMKQKHLGEMKQKAKAAKYLTGGQAKIAAKAPPPDKIDEKDFAVLRAEKAKGRGMGLQDESVQPGKVMKARVGKEVKADPTKTITDKGQFIKRRKKLMGLGKATRLGRTAALVGTGLGAAAAGIGKAVKEYKDYKSAKNRDEAKVKKMGGGMMNKPMGYSKGTMVMARGCKLGRKKATKIT